jgi:hypothetical protein
MAIDVEQALVYKLTNTSAISNLVSTRMHPLRLPDTAALPAITYTQISAPVTSANGEASSNALTSARYQFDGWAATYSGAVALGKAIFDALHGYQGTITSGSDTFKIQACLRVDKRSENDAETGLYWVSQDFMIWY